MYRPQGSVRLEQVHGSTIVARAPTISAIYERATSG